MTVAPRVGLAGLLGQGNLGTVGSREAVLAYLDAEHPDAILPLRSWHIPYSMFALPIPRDVPVAAGMVGVGVMDYHGSNDDRRQADRLHASLFRSSEPEEAAAEDKRARIDILGSSSL